MDLALIARADVFPLSRARAAGIDQAELRRMLREGRCHRLHHGWFSVRRPVDAADAHTLRVAALLEQYAGHAVASDVSALGRLALPCFEPDWTVAHLKLTDPTRKGHTKPGLVVTPALRQAQAARLPATTQGTVHPALAIALAGLADVRSFLVPADAALARRLVDTDDLALAVDALGRKPGIGRVRAALPHANARHESPGETLTAHVLRLLGFRVVPQYAIRGTQQWTPGGAGYRADFGLVGTWVLVEFDGRVKYATQQDLWDEKRREDRIRSLGFEVVRLTWADLRDPDRVRALIETAIRRSRGSRSRSPSRSNETCLTSR